MQINNKNQFACLVILVLFSNDSLEEKKVREIIVKKKLPAEKTEKPASCIKGLRHNNSYCKN